jgi:hypothetical protein
MDRASRIQMQLTVSCWIKPIFPQGILLVQTNSHAPAKLHLCGHLIGDRVFGNRCFRCMNIFVAGFTVSQITASNQKRNQKSLIQQRQMSNTGNCKIVCYLWREMGGCYSRFKIWRHALAWTRPWGMSNALTSL